MRNAHNFRVQRPMGSDKLALLHVEPAVQREADELIAILVASARIARAR